ncbi:MAG TPA: hypothetical protein VHD61_05245 [Lacunisphaera sp.]|nr:hypothetical protein [Lacunisphaera sp.]
MNLRRFLPGIATLAIFVAVAWFFHWTVGSPRASGDPQRDYYNLLVDGFQHGQLAMDVKPDPWLGVDNTRVKSYLLDASFHHGRYYLYFGVTPALVLFWPWTAVTGHDLPEPLAAMLLASAAFALSLGWLRTLRREFFPAAGWPVRLVAVLLLGLGSGYAVVLRRPMFYEIAIFSGVAATMGCLWCLTLAVRRTERTVRWLGAASLCAGLAAGSRPTLIPGAVLAVGLVAVVLWRRGPAGAGRRGLVAAAVPLGLVLAGLAWYNWARFDNPFEFGLHYQVGSNGNGFPFTLGAMGENLREYYFNPPGFSWFFPFFSPGPRPAGSYPEEVHGQFFWLPVLGLALVFAVRAARLRNAARDLPLLVAAAGVWAGTALLVVTMAPPHSNRYQLDFHPVFAVLGLTGLFAAATAPRWRWWVRAALLWSLVVMFFNVCVSFQVHDFFHLAHPRQFEALARVADRVVWPLHRLAGPRFGGVEIVARFPAAAPGTIEHLLDAGGGQDVDSLLVRYTAPGRGRLMFRHTRYGEVEGEEFDLQPGRARWLNIQLGTMYPPAWHPWYGDLPPDLARARHRVAVSVDGTGVLDRDVNCYLASSNQVVLGGREDPPPGEFRFSGEVARVAGLKADEGWLRTLTTRTGPRALRIVLPRDRFGATEPLVVSGEQDRGDVLAIDYVKDGVVRFSILHAGWSEPVRSDEIAWDYRQPMELAVALGASGAGSPPGVRVELDGLPVFARAFEPYPARPAQSYLGCLPWAVNGCRSMFGGEIAILPLESAATVALRHARLALLAGRAVELRFTIPGEPANAPLLTTGRPGIGDGIFLERVAPGLMRLGFDHWGSQPIWSAPFPAVPGQEHRLRLSFGVRVPEQGVVSGRLQATCDGQVVFDSPVDLFPADPDHVFYGANPTGMSTSRPEFPGGVTARELAGPP